MAKCKACGVELRPGARFCDMCGTKVERICPHCGGVLRDQAKYCDLCGIKLPLEQKIARPKVRGMVAAGRLHTVALREDGTVLATGDNQFGQCDVETWSDIVTIAAGKYHTVGFGRTAPSSPPGTAPMASARWRTGPMWWPWPPGTAIP